VKPITVKWPPVLYNRLDGQRVASSGPIRVEVPADTTQANISKYMVVEQRKPVAEPQTHILKGSRGRAYTVRLLSSGTWTCTCPGNHFRGKCKHVDQIKKKEHNND
jgi:hypothetical protein